MAVQIRVMALEDYDGVHELWLSCPGVGLSGEDDSREGIGRLLKRNPGTCFVAEEEGRILGTALSGHDGRRGHLYHVAVAPQRQGEGLGRALVARCAEALRAEGIRKASLVAFSANQRGNAFWEALGYAPRGDLTYRDKVLLQGTGLGTGEPVRREGEKVEKDA